MTEPTTESLGAAQEFAAAYAATGWGTFSDDAIRGVALALDEMKGRVAVDPLVEVFRTLPLNGDAGCDKLTDAEWLTVANAARAELAKIGWQIGPIETPAAPDIEQALRDAVEAAIEQFGIGYIRKLSWFPSARMPESSPAHPLTDEQVVENCARLVDAWGYIKMASALREGRPTEVHCAFLAEYRRQTSALTTPVLTEEMVRRATGQHDAFPVLTWRTGHMQGAISCQTFADNLNAELAGGRS